MSETTKIEWADATVNFWWGCTKVSPGCAHCYADTLSKRFGKDVWGKGQPRENHIKGATKLAMKLERAAARDAHELAVTGKVTDQDGSEIAWHRPRVFCASMSDWLDDEVPIEWMADMLNVIRQTPHLDWLLLTKRPENWRKRVTDAIMWNWCEDDQEAALHAWGSNWLNGKLAPANVWIGTTVEDQRRADERIPALLKIPAKVRFLSCEPLLENVDLMYPESVFPDGPERCCNGYECGCMGYPIDPPMLYGIHWVITGGESGHACRPFDPDWARSLRDQCQAAGVAFFMKQMGGERKPFPEIPADLQIQQFPSIQK